MDMQGIDRRQAISTSASANVTAAKPASSDDSSKPAAAANTAPDNADTPATTSHLSPASRFMGFLQHLETEHPEQTKRVLNGIADRLHFDAQFAGPFFGNRLNAIADRFQKAADTGDLSNLAPQNPGFGHHAMRAYQSAAGHGDANAAADAGAAVAGKTTPPANSTAPADAASPAADKTTPVTSSTTDDTANTVANTAPDDTTPTDAAAAMAAAANPATADTTATAANQAAAASGSDQDVKASAIG